MHGGTKARESRQALSPRNNDSGEFMKVDECETKMH